MAQIERLINLTIAMEALNIKSENVAAAVKTTKSDIDKYITFVSSHAMESSNVLKSTAIGLGDDITQYINELIIHKGFSIQFSTEELMFSADTQKGFTLWVQTKNNNPGLTFIDAFGDMIFDAQKQPDYTKEIVFEEEYHQAGLQILTYFHKYVESNYPDQSIKVTIRQDGLTVFLSIETDDGQIEEIEKLLGDYIGGVMGHLPLDKM